MLFNSFQFAVFFVVVTTLFFLLPHRFRWFLLLAASCYFYMVFIPVYILILAATIVVDYFAGILIEKAEGKRRKFYLILSLISNVGFLAFFKYFNFINDNMRVLAQWLHWNYPIEALGILLPLGLSFHTFQAMSYTIEVYRGRQKAEQHFGIYALYVMFYPQLVAGPIERPQNLIRQFYEKKVFDPVRVIEGLKLMLWGLFKKVVVADRLAIVVDQVYGSPSEYSGLPFIIATYFFAFQIFCDFSGYSDIAIGAAKVMGFDLMTNFDRPYAARSIPEFWRRWHISLSTWFRDYLYIPLGGNRISRGRWYGNLMIVFLVSGLWHGANWTYVIWGALHAFYMLASVVLTKLRYRFSNIFGLSRYPSLHKVFKIFLTFNLVAFAWIFFRANNLEEAWYIVRHLFDLGDTLTRWQNLGWSSTMLLGYDIKIGKVEFLIAVSSILFMEYIQWIQRQGTAKVFFLDRPIWFRWATYYALIILIVVLGVDRSSQFIYFQF